MKTQDSRLKTLDSRLSCVLRFVLWLSRRTSEFVLWLSRRTSELASCVFLCLGSCVLCLTPCTSEADSTSVRIKDIARISCVYDTQLYGYGLVVGLNGTGDSAGAAFTVQSVINMMRRFGIGVPKGRISLKNVAAVMVTAELPFFAKAGSRIDVLVSSIGDAKSIAGGTLLATPLGAPDFFTNMGDSPHDLHVQDAPRPHVLAQGPVSVGGFSVSAGQGNNVQKNHPTVGRVPNGGVIMSSIGDFNPGAPRPDSTCLAIVLNEPDFTTATRVVSAIFQAFSSSALGEPGIWGKSPIPLKKGKIPHTPEEMAEIESNTPVQVERPIARAVDAATVEVTMPESDKENLVAFISRLENVKVVPDSQALVVIDERTGTIVVGKDVRIAPVAVSHSNLNIQIRTEEEVSQPPALSAGETAIVSRTDLAVQEERQKIQVIRGGAGIDDVVRALNLIGVTARDMIAILQAIKQAGALHARLVIQ